MEITRPSITRLARRAGVKSVSDDCFNDIRQLISSRMHDVAKNVLLVNSEHQTKTLMADDIYKALTLMNVNLAESSELGTATCSK
jgi:histone H3/H4